MGLKNERIGSKQRIYQVTITIIILYFENRFGDTFVEQD